MASLEKRGQSFRIVFRYQGVKYARALSTRSEKAAAAALARLDDNLHRLELGTLDPPDGDDPIGDLLGDGRPMRSAILRDEASGKPQTPQTLTLAALFADYWSNLPTGSLVLLSKATVFG